MNNINWANGCWIGALPAALYGLTYAEELVIARAHTTKCWAKINSGSGNIREFVVFDIDDSRIDPLDIARKLKGALVETSFKLIHYCFGGDDSFVAEIEQVVILCYAAVQLPSPYKKALSKPYRPAAMSPEEVHAQQQLAVKHFSLPYSAAGPSNLPAPTQKDVNKRKASSEPEGSDAKRAKDGENQERTKTKGTAVLPLFEVNVIVQLLYH
ncbi:hypothetical protein DFH09DRAFT_1317044 [Mycena vulgaris]|nr:hypothetical protein DFH09DRAFT_1323077 [Mycena vulgaris]KAJ6558779.1 hypothetical protein DFH09DRAFT_1317044 [Mycena vulgaris]